MTPPAHPFEKPAAQQQAHKRLLEALNRCDAFIRWNPNAPGAHCTRGFVLHALKRFDEARESYASAIGLDPDFAEAYYGCGNALQKLDRLNEALESYTRAIALKPDYALAYNNRGNVLRELGRADGALQNYTRAIELKPDAALAYNNKGNTLKALDRFDEAVENYDRAIAIKPGFAGTHIERGNALRELHRLEEAIESYDRAIELAPDFAETYWNKSLCTLAMGDLEEGWRLYEWRKKMLRPSRLPKYLRPEWSGKTSLEGKTLFIRAEQGLGDTIQFSRYALLAESMGAKVILSVQDPLAILLTGMGRTIETIAVSTPPRGFDCHVALLSMPLAFKTDLQSVPAHIPYLRAEPDRVLKWKSRIGSHGFKVGICWQGGEGTADAGRSFPLACLRGVAGLSSVRLISLQKHAGLGQLSDLPADMKVETLGLVFDSAPAAFTDTAAAMECLDLVVAADTAVAHLAGALGRPAWLALKHVPDWRWLLERADTPWYPTMRLFRQTIRGDWSGVFAAMEERLAQRVGFRGV